jgi:hypothetical protein
MPSAQMPRTGPDIFPFGRGSPSIGWPGEEAEKLNLPAGTVEYDYTIPEDREAGTVGTLSVE